VVRYYKIINKDTGLAIEAVLFSRPLNGSVTYYIKWVKNTDAEYTPIEYINYLIKRILECKLGTALDNCTLEVVERKFVAVKPTLKLETVRNRHEKICW